MLKNALNFMGQVKQEFFRISWGTKKQALSITGVVFVLVTVTALYFFALDWVLSNIVGFLLKLGA